jgi:hypothetical protein
MKGDDRDDYEVLKTERMTGKPKEPRQRPRGYVSGKKLKAYIPPPGTTASTEAYYGTAPTLGSGYGMSPAGLNKYGRPSWTDELDKRITGWEKKADDDIRGFEMPIKTEKLAEIQCVCKAEGDHDSWISQYKFTNSPLVNEDSAIIGGIYHHGRVKVYDVVIDAEQSKFSMRAHGFPEAEIAKVMKATLKPAAGILEIHWDREPTKFFVELTYRFDNTKYTRAHIPSISEAFPAVKGRASKSGSCRTLAAYNEAKLKTTEEAKAEALLAKALEHSKNEMLNIWRYGDKACAMKVSDPASVHKALKETFGDDLDLHKIEFIGKMTVP